MTTEDDYILDIYRIPHGKNNNGSTRPPILLVHGATATSFVWIFDESCLGKWGLLSFYYNKQTTHVYISVCTFPSVSSGR